MATVPALARARVAPTVEDLEIIPGPLSQRLKEWAALRSIPEDLRGAIGLDDPVARWLPGFEQGGKAGVALLQACGREEVQYLVQPLERPEGRPTIHGGAALRVPAAARCDQRG